ncbi:MAG: MoaF C-terminal domain-containing protein [Gammaproteobacteria bacterium]
MATSDPRHEALQWAQISAIASGLEQHRTASSSALAGLTVALAFDNGRKLELVFSDPAATVRINNRLEEKVDVVEVAPDLFLVGFQHQADPRRSTALTLDLANSRVLWTDGRLPTLEEAGVSLLERVAAGGLLSAVKAGFITGTITAVTDDDRPRTLPQPGRAPAPSAGLVGKHIRYVYGDGGVYEHFYLNEKLFTWHCIDGPERGLADTEACECYAVREYVYLFCWREKIIPTLGLVLINTDTMRSNGFLSGIDTRTGEVSYFPVGARGELIGGPKA